MKYLLSLICIYTLIQDKTNREIFNDFHTVYANEDFRAMDSLLADNFVGLNEQGEVNFSRLEYIAYMKDWNQVFETKWNVESVEEVGGKIKSIEYDTDEFNDYFYGGKNRIQYIYTFINNKIKSIQAIPTRDGQKAEEIFNKRFGLFYQWVEKEYPAKIMYCNSNDKESAQEVKLLLKKYLALIN